MKTVQYLIIIYMMILCWVVLLCYSSDAAAAGDETSFRVHSNIRCIDHEREALLQFKQGIESDNCGLLSSWGVTEDCCNWRGIRCSNRTGHVIMLHLQGRDIPFGEGYFNCLEGKLDHSLFELTHLKYLDLSFNNYFNQTIPSSFDSLTELEHLNFSKAGFFGEIPPQLGNLSKLASLDLSKNYEGYPLAAKSLQWLSHLTLLREIHLSYSNLSEATDWFQTISKLPSLRILNLDVCHLPSSSLSYINSSSSLRVVSLSGNTFNGTWIFQWLFNLSRNNYQFEHLDLSRNSLSVPLPSSFGKYMHTLSYLDLSDNSLSGPLPSSFGKYMHTLSYLDLSDNSLSGPLPSSFGKYMHTLSYLDLSENSLSGPLPSSFGKYIHTLSYLDLSENSLSGPLPSSFGKYMHTLSYLDLSYNRFEGNVFQALSSGCANKPLLEYLNLTMNQFWGSIPNMISNFSSMRELHLHGNHLNGTISQGIGQLSMLEILDVSNNSLKATLNHNHFLNLSRLRILKLSDNPALVHDVSDNWVPPFQLDVISLRSCKLGPSFPKWLLTQTNFSYLDISTAQISGELPPTFWTRFLSSNLRYLNMSHNMIHGVLPNLSTSFDFLEVIDLSSNYFEGSIPSFVGDKNVHSVHLNDNMFSDATQLLCPRIANSNLTEVDLSNNLLSGKLPNCLMKMDQLLCPRIAISYLTEVDLSNNLLSGKLPNCLMKMDQLRYLHLENNKFSGNIPTSIGDLQLLKYLHLQNNSFSGELPLSMLNCMSLQFLDLGHNSLTGYIPPSIGNAFENLAFLNLRGNKFFGKLPLSLCKLSNLHMLDVAMNHISGTIPNCIYNFTAMMNVSEKLQFDDPEVGFGEDYFVALDQEAAIIEWKREEQRFGKTPLGLLNYIDLSNNELEGEIPDGISNLTKLMSLNLARNNLTGSIPSNIGQLTLLELLDLSNNHLSGAIPTSLAEVSFLGTLNLSNNNLSGRIPLGTQLQGFDPSSYMGNTLLCGTPLQKCAGDEPPAINGRNFSHQEEHGNDNFYLGLCISVVLGFIIGFWGVCGTLVVKRSWRHAFFRFFGDIKDKIYVIVVVKFSRVWRKP